MIASQKILKVGNSYAVTIPKGYVIARKWASGQNVYVEADPQVDLVQIRSTHAPSSLTPEFKKWLDEVSNKYEDTIKELAKR